MEPIFEEFSGAGAIMPGKLTATRELLHAARDVRDVEALRKKFVDCYDELETGLPSLVSVARVAYRGLGVNNDSVAVFYRSALEVARRVDDGDDKTSNNKYHNPLHFAKVGVNFRALAAMHNALNPNGALSDLAVAGGLFAAVCHDICHKGGTNTVANKHQQFRLEQRSIDKALDWALPPDGTDPSTKAARKTLRRALGIVLATDTSNDGQHISPALYVRRLYDGETHLPDVPFSKKINQDLPTPLHVTTAALLHDADVLASLLNEACLEREDLRFRQELHTVTGKLADSDAARRYFLNNVLEGRTTTPTSRLLTDSFIRGEIARLNSAPVP